MPRLAVNISGSLSSASPSNQAIQYAVAEKGASIFLKSIGRLASATKNETIFLESHYKIRRIHGEWNLTGDNLGKLSEIMNAEAAIKEALEMHVSTLGGMTCCAPLENAKESATGESLVEYFQKRSGYRLVLREARFKKSIRRGENLVLEQKWEQIGTASIYIKYPLRAYLVNNSRDIALSIDNSFDATSWLNDGNLHDLKSVFKVPDCVPKGNYELRIALVDKKTGHPAVNLAIEGKDNADPNRYGRYRLARINIK